MGKRFENLGALINGTVNRPKAAIVFDWENWWAVEDTQGPRLDLDYKAWIVSHYRTFWEAGIEADFIGMDADLEGYALVSAPLNYMYREGWADKVKKFVSDGGRFVTTCFSGEVNDTDLCFLGHHPLADVLGIVPEEIDAPSEEFENCFRYGGKEYPAKELCGIVHPKETAEVLAVYERDFYAGCPVVTCNPYGKGKTWYLAAESDLAFLRAFYKDVFAEAGLHNALGAELPYGVTVTERCGAAGEEKKQIVFVMNFKNEPVTVEGIGRWTDAESGEACEGSLRLEAFQCRVLTR